MALSNKILALGARLVMLGSNVAPLLLASYLFSGAELGEYVILRTLVIAFVVVDLGRYMHILATREFAGASLSQFVAGNIVDICIRAALFAALALVYLAFVLPSPDQPAIFALQLFAVGFLGLLIFRLECYAESVDAIAVVTISRILYFGTFAILTVLFLVAFKDPPNAVLIPCMLAQLMTLAVWVTHLASSAKPVAHSAYVARRKGLKGLDFNYMLAVLAGALFQNIQPLAFGWIYGASAMAALAGLIVMQNAIIALSSAPSTHLLQETIHSKDRYAIGKNLLTNFTISCGIVFVCLAAGGLLSFMLPENFRLHLQGGPTFWGMAVVSVVATVSIAAGQVERALVGEVAWPLMLVVIAVPILLFLILRELDPELVYLVTTLAFYVALLAMTLVNHLLRRSNRP